jgi:hypothetical protein
MVTLLPKSPEALMRIAVLAGALIHRNILALWQLTEYRPRDGDIVFQSLPHRKWVDPIEGVFPLPPRSRRLARPFLSSFSAPCGRRRSTARSTKKVETKSAPISFSAPRRGLTLCDAIFLLRSSAPSS